MDQVAVLDLSGGAAALFTGAEALLKFGPLGLSALLLVLGAIVFLSRNVSEMQAVLMRQFMWVGGFLAVFFGVIAFLPTTMAKSVHDVHLSVQPIDLAAYRDIPRPVLTVNSKQYAPPLDIKVGQEVTAILDVSEAFAQMQSNKAKLDALTADNVSLKASLLKALKPAVEALSDARARMTGHCPSGSTTEIILQRVDTVAAALSATIDRVE